jgi:SH3-like domain-containing protein
MSRFKRIVISLLGVIIVSFCIGVFAFSPVQAGEMQQQPTVAVPTVTGTPTGPTARVNLDNDQINVRSGPGTDYAEIGVLIAGQAVPAIGKSAAGLWIQIEYSGIEGGIGWIYSPLVTLSQGAEIPIVEPPPTPTPRVTPTIDPTLAAQFIAEVPATRLPTYTPPAPLVIPTYPSAEPVLSARTFPVGVVIIAMASLGMLGSIFSLFLRR